MPTASDVAEKYATYEGFRLADFREVAVPYYILYMDSVVAERRPISPATEFALKAIRVGLDHVGDIASILGFTDRYRKRFFGELEQDGYLSSISEDQVRLLPKGEAVLDDSYETSVEERQISVLWDAVQRLAVDYVDDLMKESDVNRDQLLVIRASPMTPPDSVDISIHNVRSLWAKRRTTADDATKELIRLGAIRKRMLRFRTGVALVYVAHQGFDSRVKFAFDVSIDEDFSRAFAEQRGPSRLGIEEDFQRRAATLALKQRVTGMETPVATKEYMAAIARRSALRITLSGLQQRIKEERRDDMIEKLRDKQQELTLVEQQIAEAPVRQLLAFEVHQLLRQALQDAKSQVFITTTIPTVFRCDFGMLTLLANALDRGVRIHIYISDKGRDGATKDSITLTAARELEKLSTASKGLQIRFLHERTRAFFEIVQDTDMLVVANEPSLGSRDDHVAFRPFVGICITNEKAIEAYQRNYFSGEKLKFREGPSLKQRSPHRKLGPTVNVVKKRRLERDG